MYIQNESCHKRKSLLHIPSDMARHTYFFAEWVGHFICREDFYIKRSGMPSYLLLYTCSGSGVINFNGKSSVLKGGDVIFLDCTLPHEYFPADDCWEFKYVHFCGRGTKALFNKICEDGGVVFHPAENIEIFFDRIFECVEKVSSEERLSELIYRALMRIASSKRESDSDWLKNTLSYISENYSLPLGVAILADRVHLSRSFFSSKFKRHLGIGVREYIENFRIETAKKMLGSTVLSVSDIATDCGFSDSATFIRAFSRVVGTSPIKYRQGGEPQKEN